MSNDGTGRHKGCGKPKCGLCKPEAQKGNSQARWLNSRQANQQEAAERADRKLPD
jgi:hypothetical protein